MMNASSSVPCRGIAPARYGVSLIGALVAALLLGGCGAPAEDGRKQAGSTDRPVSAAPSAPASPATGSDEPPSVPVPPAAAAGSPQAADPAALRPAGVEPASLTIPAMGLTESLIPLGILSDGTMEVPEDYADVGWFTGGGTPGGYGPTVIAGHVDSRSGPAVFFRLGEMVVGDRFTVTGVDGAPFEYEVYKIEDHPKAEFPTAAVFGATLDDEVRLVTCGGDYNEAIGRYTDNLVVFAGRV